MKNRSYTDQWKSVASRLNFVQNQLGAFPFSDEKAQEAHEALSELFERCRKLYGEKIAFEIEIKVGQK